MGPGVRFLSASYDLRLATRDNVKCRRIIESKWYRENWGERVYFTPDQNTKTYYENAQGGARFATGVDAAVTGEGGDIGIIDDPINVKNANSRVAIDNVITWWTESMPTRLNDAKHGVFVIVMQRCNERDLTGYIIAQELGFDHLCLPEKYEANHPFPVKSSIGFKDPRAEDGELLWGERFGEPEFTKVSLSLGIYGTAGQLQQRPSPRAGGIFKREWFEIVDAPPARRKIVRRWDLASTIPESGTDPDWTAGVKLSMDDEGFFYVEHVSRFREDPHTVETNIKNTASQDGRSVKVRISQDPGQAGKSQVRYYVRKLPGYDAAASPESGDKEARADPPAAQAEAGNIKIVRDKEGDRWNAAFLDELCNFPFGTHDDQVDAFTGAFDDLVTIPGKMKVQAIHGW
jgi:predicted phage terminase large subunit-like protein